MDYMVGARIKPNHSQPVILSAAKDPVARPLARIVLDSSLRSE